MADDTEQDKTLDEQYPLQECLDLWIKIEFGKDDKKAQTLLILFFQRIVSRFKHFVDKLANPREWKDELLIRGVMGNMEYVENTTKEVLKKKSEVSKWGEDWNEFFAGTAELFSKDFKTLKFDVFPILDILSSNEIKPEKQGLVDASDFKRLMGVYDIFKEFSDEYENFIRKLEAKIKPIQGKIKKEEIDLVEQLFSRLKDKTP